MVPRGLFIYHRLYFNRIYIHTADVIFWVVLYSFIRFNYYLIQTPIKQRVIHLHVLCCHSYFTTYIALVHVYCSKLVSRYYCHLPNILSFTFESFFSCSDYVCSLVDHCSLYFACLMLKQSILLCSKSRYWVGLICQFPSTRALQLCYWYF